MSCTLEKYTNAVAMRKAKDKRGNFNVAIMLQLENNDIPLLLEIIRVQDNAIRAVIDIIDEEDPDEAEPPLDDIGRVVSGAHLRAEELASSGSLARWGDVEEGWNGGPS